MFRYGWKDFLLDWLGHMLRMVAAIIGIGVPLFLIVWLATTGPAGMIGAALLFLLAVSAFMAWQDNLW